MHDSTSGSRPLVRVWRAAAVALAALPASAGAQVADIACSFCSYDEVRHIWRIPDHKVLSTPVELQKRCAYIEMPQTEYYVAADGTRSSIFEVKKVLAGTCQSDRELPLPVFLDPNWQPVASPDPDVYGAFEVEEQTEEFVRFTYTHPVEPPPSGVKYRVVRIGVVYWSPSFGEAMVNNVLEVRVTRPPVVMTHGLWSNRGSFEAMEEELAGSTHYADMLYRVDYEASNDASFVANRRVVELGVYSVLKQAAAKDYAAGKADLVGHSMGGILSRLYVQGEYYNRDVRRIVTCNTPHSGSQMANWLRGGSPQAGLACSVFPAFLGSCGNGAVEDLGVYSNAVNNLLNNPTGTPDDLEVHALLTVDDLGYHLPVTPGSVPVPGSLRDLLVTTLGVCASDDFFATVFNGDDHDLVVAAESQAGGLAGLETSVYQGIYHIGSTSQPPVIEQVMRVLDDPPGSSRFAAYYDPPALAYSTPPPCIPPPAPLGAAAVPSLAIAGPSVGTVVTAGSPLAVTVNASAEIAGVLLIIGVRGDEVFVLRRDTPGPTFEIAVPSELAGEQPLLAIGLDAAGRAIAASQPVTLTVAVAATLQSLSVYPPSLFLVQGETASLEVRGSYDDGVVRDLSRVATLDLSLATANARRSGVNLVTLDAPGDDTLTVALGGVAAAVVPITAYAVPPEAPQPRPVRRRLR